MDTLQPACSSLTSQPPTPNSQGRWVTPIARRVGPSQRHRAGESSQKQWLPWTCPRRLGLPRTLGSWELEVGRLSAWALEGKVPSVRHRTDMTGRDGHDRTSCSDSLPRTPAVRALLCRPVGPAVAAAPAAAACQRDCRRRVGRGRRPAALAAIAPRLTLPSRPKRSSTRPNRPQLTIELFAVHDQAGLDEFVGKIARSVKRAASKAVRDVGRTPIARTVSRAATDVGRSKLARSVGRAATDVSRGVAKVGAAVPMLGTAAKLVSRATPLGRAREGHVRRGVSGPARSEHLHGRRGRAGGHAAVCRRDSGGAWRDSRREPAGRDEDGRQGRHLRRPRGPAICGHGRAVHSGNRHRRWRGARRGRRACQRAAHHEGVDRRCPRRDPRRRHRAGRLRHGRGTGAGQTARSGAA